MRKEQFSYGSRGGRSGFERKVEQQAGQSSLNSASWNYLTAREHRRMSRPISWCGWGLKSINLAKNVSRHSNFQSLNKVMQMLISASNGKPNAKKVVNASYRQFSARCQSLITEFTSDSMEKDMCEEQELIGGPAFSSGRGLAVDGTPAVNSRADGTAVQGHCESPLFSIRRTFTLLSIYDCSLLCQSVQEDGLPLYLS